MGGARTARPPGQHVRHAFWKYPILAAVLAAVIIGVAAMAGSPNWPRATIAGTDREDPGGAILAMTMELDGTSASWTNTAEPGMGAPSETFVLAPVKAFGPLLDPSAADAVAQYQAASPDRQHTWAAAYHQALNTIIPMSGDSEMGGMAVAGSPDYSKIDTLQGDFGPVPAIVKADLVIAQHGYLDQYLEGLQAGHSLHLVNICLYDHPSMLSQATAEGLTDDQWGMIKERGFAVGPWYLIIPAIIHVKLPGGATGVGFALWNLVFALIVILVIPLLPGLRSVPRRLGLYRLIYRYPVKDELTVPGSAENARSEEAPT